MESRNPTPEEAQAELNHRSEQKAQQQQQAQAELDLRAQEKQQKKEQVKYLTGANRTPMDLTVDIAQGVIKGLGRGVFFRLYPFWSLSF